MPPDVCGCRLEALPCCMLVPTLAWSSGYCAVEAVCEGPCCQPYHSVDGLKFVALEAGVLVAEALGAQDSSFLAGLPWWDLAQATALLSQSLRGTCLEGYLSLR